MENQRRLFGQVVLLRDYVFSRRKFKTFLLKMCSEKLKITTETSFKSVDIFIMTVFFKRRMETSLSKITQTSKELCK